MTKWQYRSIRVGAMGGDEQIALRKQAKAEGWSDLQAHSAISAKFIGWMNELGAEGWEAVGIITDSYDRLGDLGSAKVGVYTILFKRPVED